MTHAPFFPKACGISTKNLTPYWMSGFLDVSVFLEKMICPCPGEWTELDCDWTETPSEWTESRRDWSKKPADWTEKYQQMIKRLFLSRKSVPILLL